VAEDYAPIYIAVGAFLGGVVVGLILSWMFGGCPSHPLSQIQKTYEQYSKTTMSNTEEWTPIEDAEGNLKKLIVKRKVEKIK
jgi:uncharacterized membrane protein SpoIIM required for sporulation